MSDLIEGRDGATAVLGSNDVAFGVMTMLGALVKDVCVVKPFREEQEARTWFNTQ